MPAPNSAQVLLAKRGNETTEETQDLRAALGAAGAGADMHAGDQGSIAHVTPALVTVWKPGPQGYRPVLVPSSNLSVVLDAGFLPYCPDCGRDECGGGVNDCPERTTRQFARCPICRKRVYDYAITAPVIPEDVQDPNEIVDLGYLEPTPERRIRALLDQHMLAYHPREGAALGLRTQNPAAPAAGAPVPPVQPDRSGNL